MSLSVYLLLTAGIVAAVAVWLRRLVVARTDPRRLLVDIEREVHELAIEINQTGDQTISVLEDRIAVARELLDSLELLLQRAEVAPAPVEENPAKEPSTEMLRPERVEVSHGAEAPLKLSINAAASEGVVDEAVPEDDAPIDPGTRVRQLYGEGLAPHQIARRTGLAIGEVELIISLRERRGVR